MNWCYDCIFQAVWKNRIGSTVIIIPKNKISKNLRIFLNGFCGYTCALRGFICLNPLSTNPTKWPNTLKQFVGIADELPECV